MGRNQNKKKRRKREEMGYNSFFLYHRRSTATRHQFTLNASNLHISVPSILYCAITWTLQLLIYKLYFVFHHVYLWSFVSYPFLFLFASTNECLYVFVYVYFCMIYNRKELNYFIILCFSYHSKNKTESFAQNSNKWNS